MCTGERQDAGPNNNWMAPAEAKTKVGALFTGAMQGRTMYVVPYLMGPVTSPLSPRLAWKSPIALMSPLSMRIMTRMGQAALDRLGSSDDFQRSALARGSQSRSPLYHAFPRRTLIWSVGSGYGGNALLGKKCFALRLGSYMAREEGWLAEHMLILGIEEPSGRTTYVAGAFPSRLRQNEHGHARAPGQSTGRL